SVLNRANYPVPIRIPYTLNFWTEYRREMNLFKQQLLTLFKRQYTSVVVDLDSISPYPVYGMKEIVMYQDGPIAITGDIEPGNEERDLRRTFPFYMDAWLWDFNFGTAFPVKEFVLEIYSDRDLTQLLETKSTPQSQVLVAGVNGVQTAFGPVFVNPNCLPVIENTFLIDATIGGNFVRGRDDGSGNLSDSGGLISSGSVNYSTGEVSITYTTPPDAGTDITVKYFTTNQTVND
ncbi:MAG: hypothetical protein MJA83_03430, partial [Gammaproteobacteria bacterium]|nr:hypothetical protein [Gammaproteobacteria bacterium]